MRSNFLSLKIITIVILVAIFWGGLFFITSLVSERQGYQQAFLKEISQNNISPIAFGLIGNATTGWNKGKFN